MKLQLGLHSNKCSHHFQFQVPKQLGFSAAVVLVIAITHPDLAGIHQKVKEIVPWLQVGAATTTTVSKSLTIAKAFKKSDKTLKK